MKHRPEETTVWNEIDKMVFVTSLFLLPFLSIAYFLIYSFPMSSVKDFIISIITNIIPTCIIFDLSYLLLRHINEMRLEENEERLVRKIGNRFFSDTKIPRELLLSFPNRENLLDKVQKELLEFMVKQGGDIPIDQSTIINGFIPVCNAKSITPPNKDAIIYRLENLRLLGFLKKDSFRSGNSELIIYAYNLSDEYQKELEIRNKPKDLQLLSLMLGNKN